MCVLRQRVCGIPTPGLNQSKMLMCRHADVPTFADMPNQITPFEELFFNRTAFGRGLYSLAKINHKLVTFHLCI